MRISPVVEHVRQHVPAFEGRVAGGLDTDVVMGSAHMKPPAAYIIQAEDDAAELQSQTSYLQEIRDSIDIVVVLATRNEQGNLEAELLHEIRRQLFLALAGWEPHEGYDGLIYNGGELVQLDRSRCVYRFSFSAAFTLGRAAFDDRSGQPAETWEEYERDRLPRFAGGTLHIDAIDPMADPNLNKPGPDGRIEHEVRMELPHGET
ncbi:hypothetical protein DXK93_01640 [Achromobacter sp. K91]|uniref:phage tail terminator protein n=1 Tax=Achromobacter sp. K91 TaxID=2292262 RepID=UPI000E6709BD|nr:hypothetical protein [Achromobacter sp. K91]RIJ06056.1 hypothetical protein DXK93_01640 [Achromobacter sp. K91]